MEVGRELGEMGPCREEAKKRKRRKKEEVGEHCTCTAIGRKKLNGNLLKSVALSRGAHLPRCTAASAGAVGRGGPPPAGRTPPSPRRGPLRMTSTRLVRRDLVHDRFMTSDLKQAPHAGRLGSGRPSPPVSAAEPRWEAWHSVPWSISCIAVDHRDAGRSDRPACTVGGWRLWWHARSLDRTKVAKRSALNETHGPEWPLPRKLRHGWELRQR